LWLTVFQFNHSFLEFKPYDLEVKPSDSLFKLHDV